ncbi:MAG TPA: hypothetical protein VFS00_22800, partial [Polyangiaceae bacterium]|nr:hypothetical protein [Polyangiaceae bacterium]
DNGAASDPDTPPRGHLALAGVAAPSPGPAPGGGDGAAGLGTPEVDRAATTDPPQLDPIPPPPAGAPRPGTAAPAHAAPAAAGPAPAPDASPAPALGRTPSGLVKRAPRAPVTGEATTPASIPADDSLLASLSQYARGRGLGHAGAQAAPPPVTAPAPAPPAPAFGPAAPGLARRVRGAQLPATSPVPLRRDAAPAPARSPRQQVQMADDVYRFLSDFTAGVRRGLDHMHDGRSA